MYTLADEIFGRQANVGFSRLSAKERIFIQVWSLQGEVDNGGFYQFFFNSSGDHALGTADALRVIGAVNTAQLVDQAMSQFGPEGPSESSERRQQQLMSLSDQQQEKLSELDGIFYTSPDDLSALLARYMSSGQ